MIDRNTIASFGAAAVLAFMSVGLVRLNIWYRRYRRQHPDSAAQQGYNDW